MNLVQNYFHSGMITKAPFTRKLLQSIRTRVLNMGLKSPTRRILGSADEKIKVLNSLSKGVTLKSYEEGNEQELLK